MNKNLTGLLTTCSMVMVWCIVALWIISSAQAQQPDKGNFYRPLFSQVSESNFEQYVSKYLALNPDYVENDHEATYLNSLILSNSPYLIKHATNPIDWKAWTETNLQIAKKQNKLIFLSIGFYACYWCQVMEKESFRDLNVAEVLNQHYVSLKVDREVSPHLDAYMTTALARVKGSAGWPVTAVLMPDLSLVFIDSYVGNDALLNLLQTLANTWKDSPERLVQRASMYNKIVERNTDSTNASEVGELKWQDVLELRKNFLDMKNGGLHGTPKFPEAGLLFFLIDSLKRNGNPELMEYVRRHLESMMQRGLYDPIYGGFHRYTSDAEWTIPHYEKMLYTQALLIEAYSRAYRLVPDINYKRVVEETLTFLIKFLSTSQGLFMSSVDAVYDGIEGGLYLYSAYELNSLKPKINTTNKVTLYKKDHLFGIHLTDEQVEHLPQWRQQLRLMRDIDKVSIDQKAIISWNALLISGLKEAYLSFGDDIYKKIAFQTGNAIWDHRENRDHLTRLISNGTELVPATLEDYAYLLEASLDLYELSNQTSWLERSKSLMVETLESLYIDNEFAFSFEPGSGDKAAELIDGELINPKAVMLGNIKRLNGVTQESCCVEQLTKLKRELTQSIINEPKSQFYAAKTLKEVELPSIEPIQYFANGNGRAELIAQADGSHIVTIKMNDGWHINSNVPLDESLIATTLTSTGSSELNVYFPESKMVSFNDSLMEISVYDKYFAIVIYGLDGRLKLTVQACSDEQKLCLKPEELEFYAPPVYIASQ